MVEGGQGEAKGHLDGPSNVVEVTEEVFLIGFIGEVCLGKRVLNGVCRGARGLILLKHWLKDSQVEENGVGGVTHRQLVEVSSVEGGYVCTHCVLAMYEL